MYIMYDQGRNVWALKRSLRGFATDTALCNQLFEELQDEVQYYIGPDFNGTEEDRFEGMQTCLVWFNDVMQLYDDSSPRKMRTEELLAIIMTHPEIESYIAHHNIPVPGQALD